MKPLTFIYLVALLTLTGPSCQKGFLDQVPDDRLTLEEAFAHRNTTEQFLANVYSNVPDEFAQRFVAYNNAGPWTGGSDEAEFVWGFVTSNSMNIGSWDPTSGFVNDFWSSFYRGISSATYFMDNASKCGDCGEQLIKQYTAEARALRAMYYFYLMRIYGPVVLLGDKLIPSDATLGQVQLPRSSFDECVDFVAGELDKAAADLPVRPANADNYGRITKGIAMAFKAETLLLGASPLFNGNADYAALKNKDGKQLINQQYDENKWKRAADAAKAFIDAFVPGVYDLYRKNNGVGEYDPYLSCRDVMLDDWNKETILVRAGASVSSAQYERTPYHSGSAGEARGSGGLGATQNMVDAYFMANGLPISDPASGYVTTGFSAADTKYTKAGTYNQWVNREPRFYVGITYNGSTWLNTNTGIIQTITAYSGNSGKKVGGNDYSPTGYIVRKNMSTGNWNTDSRTLILLRLAKVYLNYAEALNEYNPGAPDILKYLNLIRDRAGIPGYGTTGLPVPASKEAMREAIRRERRIELAFENVRYFDVRRWKIALQTDNGNIYGLNIAADAPDFYNVVPFEKRIFQQKHYLFPIPQSEVNIDKEMVQNTGW